MNEQTGYGSTDPSCNSARGFYTHLVIYAVVVPAMAVVNVLTCRDYFWFVWPMLGWGVGVFCHGASVFRWFKRDKA